MKKGRMLGIYDNGSGRQRLEALIMHLQQTFGIVFDIDQDSSYILDLAISMLGSGQYNACLVTSFSVASGNIKTKRYDDIRSPQYKPADYAGLQIIEAAKNYNIPVYAEVGLIHPDGLRDSIISEVRELGGIPFDSRAWTQGDEVARKAAFERFIRGFDGVFTRK